VRERERERERDWVGNVEFIKKAKLVSLEVETSMGSIQMERKMEGSEIRQFEVKDVINKC
jgi:hypothetical protein